MIEIPSDKLLFIGCRPVTGLEVTASCDIKNNDMIEPRFVLKDSIGSGMPLTMSEIGLAALDCNLSFREVYSVFTQTVLPVDKLLCSLVFFRRLKMITFNLQGWNGKRFKGYTCHIHFSLQGQNAYESEHVILNTGHSDFFLQFLRPH